MPTRTPQVMPDHYVGIAVSFLFVVGIGMLFVSLRERRRQKARLERPRR